MTTLEQLKHEVMRKGGTDQNGNDLFLLDNNTVLVLTSDGQLLEANTRSDTPITEARAAELLEVL